MIGRSDIQYVISERINKISCLIIGNPANKLPTWICMPLYEIRIRHWYCGSRELL